MGNCSASTPSSISPKKGRANEIPHQSMSTIHDPLETVKQEFEAHYRQPIKQTARLEDFQLQRTIGIGAFSRVLSAKYGDRRLALKIRSKQKIIELQQVERILAEKRILQAIHFPFITTFAYAFKDNAYLYLALDIAAGGEMFTHLRQVQRCLIDGK
jgi:serine/threonine protein kinase